MVSITPFAAMKNRIFWLIIKKIQALKRKLAAGGPAASYDGD